jgi:hypothetical protein
MRIYLILQSAIYPSPDEGGLTDKTNMQRHIFLLNRGRDNFF